MGSGFRTFASGEVLTADNVQNYLMDQAVMVFAGTAARGSALPSPETGMTAYSTATGLQVYDGDDWVDVSTGYGVATGGASTAITVNGESYTLLTFTTDGTLTVTKAGLFDCIILAGGASGGNAGANRNAGGGGAGGLIEQTIYLPVSTPAVVVGVGGAISSRNVINGGKSAIGTYLSAAGGGTGGHEIPGLTNLGGIPGGSGGGASNGFNPGAASGGGVGFAGGAAGGVNSGGGGGGVGAVGSAGSGTTGGAGGAGVDISAFKGESVNTTRVGGGGGGCGSVTGGTASDGGGAGATSGTGTAGTANKGGGGGAGATNGGIGGSGIVLVRFKV